MKINKLLRTVSSLAAASVCLTLILTSCGGNKESEYYEDTFFAMDTYINVKLARDSGETDDEQDDVYFDDAFMQSVTDKCEAITADIEAEISATTDSGQLSEINSQIDYILGVNKTASDVIWRAYDVSTLTGGAYDPTVGTLVKLWNVTGGGPVPADDAITDALSHVGIDKLTLNDNGTTLDIQKNDVQTKLDLGGIGKGYALGKVIEYLEGTGIRYGLVSFGGNVGVFGEKVDGEEYRIGICDPDNTASAVGYINIASGYVAVSGDYERFFEENGVRYHHIFDTSTGRPADSGIRSVAVYSADATESDALSTALFVMGAERGIEFYHSGKMTFEAVFVMNDGTLRVTDGLSETFEYAETTAAE